MAARNNSNIKSSSPEPFSSSPSSMSFTPTTLHTISIIEEKPSISKQSVVSDTVIEKRWVTKTELVRVPVTYEEIYVNGKLMSRGASGILSDLKKTFFGNNETAKKTGSTESQKGSVPVGPLEMEKVIPVFGEKIIITKKMTKLNDLVIRKRRIVENKKIKVNVAKEIVRIKHPDSKVEELT